MSGEFLNGARRRATHRQVRAERVAKDVDAVFVTFAFLAARLTRVPEPAAASTAFRRPDRARAAPSGVDARGAPQSVGRSTGRSEAARPSAT